MYCFSSPIILGTVNENSFPTYVKQLREAQISRVFLCGIGTVYRSDSIIHTDPDQLENAIRDFQNAGFEVGVWIGGFGHGGVLAHESSEQRVSTDFNPIVGLDGRYSEQDFCPLDERFRACYAAGIQKIARMGPSLIMLDDDFRLNVRDRVYNIGCFCDAHLQAFYQRLGGSVPREQLEGLLFTGGENRYRSAWMELMRDTLVGFATEMRAALDQVDPTVRLGTCMCYDTWDMDGTDGIELARAFAGGTRPFLRTIGAPYHDPRVATAIESTRMQAAWCRGSGIEVFAEGDVYPRPRYNVPSKFLEMFDIALLATGETEGALKYMFDYTRKQGYENGYVERHVKNQKLRMQIADIFSGKQSVGVRVLDAMHKLEKWDMPADRSVPVGRWLSKSFQSRAARLLSQHAIPTAYDSVDYPVAIFGESARYASASDLKNGAILDVGAAQILRERGIDTGLLSAVPQRFQQEYFVENDDKISGIGDAELYRITCAQGVQILSLLLPDRTPGAYLYENKAGQRFFVLAHLAYNGVQKPATEYFNNYYRQQQLIKAIQWVGDKPLPAICVGNPFLYMIAAKGKTEGVFSLSVALFNVFADEILQPKIVLDRAYRSVRFVNCTGTLKGNTICLSELPPYGIAAFEAIP